MTPNDSFSASIRRSHHSADLAEKLGELALDSFLNDGLIKDIPFFGIPLSLLRAGNDVSAYFYAKKIIRFLAATENLSEDQRKHFIEEECSGDANIEKVGETTLMLLDKIESPQIAGMLGKAFALMVENTIPRSMFELYAHVIRNLNSYLIKQLIQCYQYENMVAVDVPTASMLSNLGLLEVSISTNYSGSTNTMPRSYGKTDFGKLFYGRIIDNTVQ
jgi:hypothetical protein